MIVFNNDSIWSEQGGSDGEVVVVKQPYEAQQPQFSIVPITFQSIADLYKGDLAPSTSMLTVSNQFRNVFSIAANLNITIRSDLNEFDLINSNFIRDKIIVKIENAIRLSVFALNRGYLLPTSPLDVVEFVNKKRQLFEQVILPQEEQYLVVKSLITLVKVYDAFKQNKINFDRILPASQVSQFDVSVDGIAKQSGNSLADIVGYQPDGDFLKRKKAIDAVQELNFFNKKPYFLFVSKPQQGFYKNKNIICFMKMKDANSYIIKKRNVFGNKQYDDIVLEKDQIKKNIDELSSNNEFLQILGFYDWVSIDEIAVYIDSEISRNTIYSYSIIGKQNKLISSTIFDDKYSLLQLTREQITKFKEFEGTENVKNVYSAISSILYNDESYGWILAAINLIESKKRLEPDEVVRNYSYIGSNSKVIDYIFSNKFFVPADIKSIENLLSVSLSSYGVYQMILFVADSIGLTYFMHGKDDYAGIKPTKESLEKVTGGLSLILRSIDSKSETVSSSIILTNLLNNSNKNTSSVNSDGKKTEDVVYDLTTIKGLSLFINFIRYVYDEYPGLIS